MEQTTMQDLQLGKWLAGAAVGAAVMYLLDPERGQQRRALSGETIRRLGRRTGTVLKRVSADAGSRLSQASSAVRDAVSDLGEHVPTSAGEAGSTGAGALSRMDSAGEAPSQTPDTKSGAAGGMASTIVRPVLDLWQRLGGGGTRGGRADRGGGGGTNSSGGESGVGSNGMRGTALAGGAALSLYAMMSRRSPFGMAAGMAGIALLARAARPRRVRSMLSAASPVHPVVVEKTIRINAAPEHVFDMFAHYENFPRYMSNVMKVRDLGQGRSHWVVRGPAGTRLQWNAVLTEHARPRRLAWKSEPGAEVSQTGAILFELVRNGTRVTVQMSYRPPAGAVGHAISSLLGSDPKQQMDEDLARMKLLVERGVAAPGTGPRAGADTGSVPALSHGQCDRQRHPQGGGKCGADAGGH